MIMTFSYCDDHIKICTFSLYCYMTKSQLCHFLAFELKKVEKVSKFLYNFPMHVGAWVHSNTLSNP
jgi:hypothetical protein